MHPLVVWYLARFFCLWRSASVFRGQLALMMMQQMRVRRLMHEQVRRMMRMEGAFEDRGLLLLLLLLLLMQMMRLLWLLLLLTSIEGKMRRYG